MTQKPTLQENDAASPSGRAEVPFGSNAMRLSPKEWIVALAVTLALLYFVPSYWEKIEGLGPGRDYRVPYRLSNDYWAAARHFRQVCRQQKTLVIGDSVIWGHYVGKAETLPHYLNELAGSDRFANLGVDGIHPAALAGLIEHYGREIAGKDVILHCNLLWMSSERHNLTTDEEFAFNHPDLVPQFFPWIPCYKESLSGRIGIVVGHKVPLFGWADHLRIAYFENTDLPRWTIEHPYDDPAAHITLELPSPDEPPSPKPVTQSWTAAGYAQFDAPWVELEASFQWKSFQRTVEILRRRGNRVFVLVGPFNEHMLTAESLAAYKIRKQHVETWLRESEIPYAIPPALPSDDYADASHPLAEGYSLLAKRLFEIESFASFRPPRARGPRRGPS